MPASPLRDDFDLQASHVQALSGRDEVAGLFAALGYNTEARLVQTAEAMGLPAGHDRLLPLLQPCSIADYRAVSIDAAPVGAACEHDLTYTAPTEQVEAFRRSLESALAHQQRRLASEAIRRVLERGKGDARFTSRLRAEYEKRLSVLLPLKQRLACTDRLIDLIVYRLYGLTEEDVGWWRGRTSPPIDPPPQAGYNLTSR